MTNVQVNFEVAISAGQRAYFAELLRGLVTEIDPGESPLEVRIVADDDHTPTVQALLQKMGKYPPPGPRTSTFASFPLEQNNTLSNIIVLRQKFFQPGENGPLEQTITLALALIYCRLYHLTWQRRGSVYQQHADPYTNDLFVMCGTVHNEYAAARLLNILLGHRFDMRIDATGETAPFFVQEREPLTLLFGRALAELRDRGIFESDRSLWKAATLPLACRFIFQPLAGYTGHLAPIPPEYPFLIPQALEENTFYREIIAPFWSSIKSDLETSFDSEFSKTEQVLRTITQTMDRCLDELRQVSIESRWG